MTLNTSCHSVAYGFDHMLVHYFAIGRGQVATPVNGLRGSVFRRIHVSPCLFCFNLPCAQCCQRGRATWGNGRVVSLWLRELPFALTRVPRKRSRTVTTAAIRRTAVIII